MLGMNSNILVRCRLFREHCGRCLAYAFQTATIVVVAYIFIELVSRLDKRYEQQSDEFNLIKCGQIERCYNHSA